MQACALAILLTVLLDGAPPPRAAPMSAENGMAPMAIYSAEAEVTVLGAMLIDHVAVDKAAKRLSPADFFQERNRTLYRAMLRVHERGAVVDVLTVSEDLKTAGEMEAAGGFDYLAALVDAVPTGKHVEHHADVIHQRARQRGVAALGRHLVRSAESGEDPDAVLTEAFDAVRRAQRTGGGRFRLLSESQLDELPPVERLLGNILMRGSFALLVGAPEAGKTLLMLDWALSIQEGLPWLTAEAHQGPVVYVYAEGTGGLGARVRAWRDHVSCPRDGDGVLFMPGAVNLLDAADVGRFLVDVDRRLTAPPVLVVFDTLSRCMVGGDENSHADVTRVISNVDRIREETGATVLLAHHLNASGERERGHTALKGAADTMVKLHLEGSIRVLRCEKQKDLPHFDPVSLRIRGHAGSAVITPTRSIGVTGVLVTESELETLRKLQGASLEEGLTATQWQEVIGGAGSTFFNHRKSLLDKGLVDREGPQRGARYRVTPRGEEALKGKLQ